MFIRFLLGRVGFDGLIDGSEIGFAELRRKEEERGIRFMSHNQSRAEKSEAQLGKPGLSGSSSQQQRSYFVAKGGGGTPPVASSSSANKR